MESTFDILKRSLYFTLGLYMLGALILALFLPEPSPLLAQVAYPGFYLVPSFGLGACVFAAIFLEAAFALPRSHWFRLRSAHAFGLWAVLSAFSLLLVPSHAGAFLTLLGSFAPLVVAAVALGAVALRFGSAEGLQGDITQFWSTLRFNLSSHRYASQARAAKRAQSEAPRTAPRATQRSAQRPAAQDKPVELKFLTTEFAEVFREERRALEAKHMPEGSPLYAQLEHLKEAPEPPAIQAPKKLGIEATEPVDDPGNIGNYNVRFLNRTSRGLDAKDSRVRLLDPNAPGDPEDRPIIPKRVIDSAGPQEEDRQQPISREARERYEAMERYRQERYREPAFENYYVYPRSSASNYIGQREGQPVVRPKSQNLSIEDRWIQQGRDLIAEQNQQRLDAMAASYIRSVSNANSDSQSDEYDEDEDGYEASASRKGKASLAASATGVSDYSDSSASRARTRETELELPKATNGSSFGIPIDPEEYVPTTIDDPDEDYEEQKSPLWFSAGEDDDPEFELDAVGVRPLVGTNNDGVAIVMPVKGADEPSPRRSSWDQEDGELPYVDAVGVIPDTPNVISVDRVADASLPNAAYDSIDELIDDDKNIMRNQDDARSFDDIFDGDEDDIDDFDRDFNIEDFDDPVDNLPGVYDSDDDETVIRPLTEITRPASGATGRGVKNTGMASIGSTRKLEPESPLAPSAKPHTQTHTQPQTLEPELPPRKEAKTLTKKIPTYKGYKIDFSEALLKNEIVDYSVIDDKVREQSEIIIDTLDQFGLPVKLASIKKGPVVTMFEYEMVGTYQVSKIAGKSDNLSYNLGAKSLRIFAPIPGRRVIGIEVNNEKRSNVYFEEFVSVVEKESKKMDLPVILGVDVVGSKNMIDLAKAPHMLVAGQTGSGKSVFVNSLICSIIATKTPREVRFFMIDPKRVELGPYEEIPHMLTPVITESPKAVKVLEYACYTMKQRLSMFKDAGCKELNEYNKFLKDNKIAKDPLPRIVIIIDEFAFLMSAPESKIIEQHVNTLAAVARATGIHLVIATQRPTSDVITGTIKANLPARVGFKVAQSLNSRIIFDADGAEQLLSLGDMLFQGQGTSELKRMQGVFISNDEAANIIERVKAFGAPDYLDESIFEDEETSSSSGGGASRNEPVDDVNDPLFVPILSFVKENKGASTSSIQRHFRVGYNRAARFTDLLFELGAIGEPSGSKPREFIKIPIEFVDAVQQYEREEGIS